MYVTTETLQTILIALLWLGAAGMFGAACFELGRLIGRGQERSDRFCRWITTIRRRDNGDHK